MVETKSTRQEEAVSHQHDWILSRNLSEERCLCGKIKISASEYQRRCDEWNNYYELVRTTPAYQDAQEMKRAFNAGDHDAMREIDKRIMQRNKMVAGWDTTWNGTQVWAEHLERTDPSTLLPKPSFPDPEGSFAYIIEG